jgi:predicted HAD superfamily Cof-like phosphohydrolase
MAASVSVGKTNFQKVQEFNRAFDMAPKEPARYASGSIDLFGRIEYDAFIHSRQQLLIEQPKLIRLRLDLIKEELGELQTAITANDFIEIRDALADILYVVYGMGDVLGIQMDLLVKNIITSLIPEISETHDAIFNSLIDYSNLDETNGRPIGLTSWNWIQIYMDNFPSRFYIKVMELGVDETSGCNNIERDRLVAKMHDIYNNLDKLCKIDEGVSGICSNLFETIAENLARLVVLDYTYSYLLDINADADFAIVHSSNMSKLCDTEADAIATVADYEAKYRTGASPYDSPYYYALPELGKWIVKNKSTGKALKNIKYQKVVFN